MPNHPSKRGHRARALAGATLLAVMACSDATAPRYVPSTFAASPGMGIVGYPIPSVQVDGRTIRVDGEMTTPTPCFHLSGLTMMDGATLVIHIDAHLALGAGQMCTQMVQPWLYMVTVPNAPANAHAVRVIQRLDANHVVLDRSVALP